VTAWTDDAWLEAARLAERNRDFARARADLEAALAATDDATTAQRVRGDLARLAANIGAHDEWAEVAARHDALAAALAQRPDDADALTALAALVADHPGYPRAATALISIAAGRERRGDRDRALAALSRASQLARGPDRLRADAERVRMLVRAGELDAARAGVAAIGDAAIAGELADRIDDAARRRTASAIAIAVIVAFVVGCALQLRRRAAGTLAALRALARPPMELLYVAPIALVLIAIAVTGNRLVAHAVIAISAGGALIAWLSGAAVHAGGGVVSARRAIAHAGAAAIAGVALAYLALDRAGLVALVVETYRHGYALR